MNAGQADTALGATKDPYPDRNNRKVGKVQLLVEGRDDVNFFSALVDFHNIGPMRIQDFGGKNNLRKFLTAFRRAPGFETVRRLGIVRDADESPKSAFQSVRDSLQKADLPAPNRAGETSEPETSEPDRAEEISQESPTVTVFILPDNDQPGMLETVLRRSIANKAEYRCVEEYLACVDNLPDVSIDRPDKARVHAWLASRRQPHVSAGYAAKKGYWDFDHRAFDALRDFLRDLKPSE